MNRLLALPLALILAAPPAAQPDPGAEQAAFDYIRATAPAAGLTPADVSELAVTSGHQSAPSGIRYVYVIQEHLGIDVADGRATVAVDGRGEVVHAAGRLVVRLTSPTSRHQVAITAEQAMETAALNVGAPGTPTTPVAVEPGPEQRTSFGTVAGTEVVARLVYQALQREGVALTWELQIPTADADHVWLVRLDAATGAELFRVDQVVDDPFGPPTRPASAGAATPAPLAPFAGALAAPPLAEGYTVYPLPLESPNHAATTPPADGRTLVTDPFDPVASPFGWHDTDGAAGAEYTVTWGNNVRAYEDRDDDDVGDTSESPDGGAGLTFTFPLDLTLDPAAYTAAATTNLFYWNNVVHDVMAAYGFDEAAGNFQETNYSGVGLGGDYVRAEAQDKADVSPCPSGEACTNNAFMFTPAEGLPPRMGMYVWTDPTPDLDGSFDAGVIIHEYAHGTSNRLTGGATAVECLHNAEQMGEGWSDWYALMMTQTPGDIGLTGRGIGTYILDEPPVGAGIRPTEYSTDFDINGSTYFDTRVLAVPHGVGYVWATMLWDLTWAFIDAYGYDGDLYGGAGGNNAALGIVTEAMKLQPCSPGFVDARDAVLAADAALFPDPEIPGFGAHYNLIWDVFAARGLGLSARQGSADTNGDNLEAFDAPIALGAVGIDPLELTFTVPAGGTADDGVALLYTGSPGDGEVVFEAAITRQDLAPSLAGGPDGFGYTFADSDDPAPGAPAPAFEDISGTGTMLGFVPTGGFAPDDEGVAEVALPEGFDFLYYGVLQPTLHVSTNGFIAFEPYLQDTFVNPGMPTAGGPDGVVAAYWNDLLLGPSGSVWVEYKDDDEVFIIQWDGVDQYPAGASSLTFQIVLHKDGTIEVQYETMTSPDLMSATVGIENLLGTDGLEAAFDAPYAASDKALVFAPPSAWVSVTPGAGVVPEGATEGLMVSVDAAGLPDGVYTADLTVTTNDGAAASTLIPITLTVGDGTSILIDGRAGYRLLGPPAAGVTVDDLAAQAIVRGVPGYRPTIATNLWTTYDAATSAWAPSAGTGEVLALGRAFRWFLPGDVPGGDVADPFTLSTTLPPNAADVDVTLDTAGDRFNYLANPFGTALDLTDVAAWPGGHNVTRAVWMYDGATRAWTLNPPAAAPWEAFRVKARPPKASGLPRVLTIPATAAGPVAGDRQRAEAVPPGLTFVLDGADTSGRPLADRSLWIAFDDDARAAYDVEEDARKFQVPAAQFVLVGTRSGDDLLGFDVRPFAAAAIPLAVSARGARAGLTLRWDASALPAGLPVLLVDLATGAEVDVRARSWYNFESTPRPARTEAEVARLGAFADGGTAEDRFVLRIGHAIADGEADVLALAITAVAPNPTATAARVSFAVPTAGPARVSVVDVRGREVAVVFDGAVEAGRHEAALDAGGLAAGVYLVRLESGGQVVTRQAAVVR
jgi:hypothetical protein